jgi:NADH-quinone oxidoreductase subunit L
LVPLVLLAGGSIGAGYIDIPKFVEPVFRRTVEAHGHHPVWLPYLATLVAVVGIAAAFYLFVLYTDLAARLARLFRAPARVLENKYGFDTAYDWLAGRGFVGGSRDVLWRGVDAALIDGFVNGSAGMVEAFARSARYVQSGLVRGYALLILGGAVALFSYLLWM